MTPGISFFYGGLVHQKNVINTMMMAFSSMGFVTIQWVLVGYTFSFGGGNTFFGDFSFGGLKDVWLAPNPIYTATIPHALYCMYQLMFAIITVGIISGGVSERIKFKTYLIFIVLWTTLVYDPVAHWVWSAYPVTSSDGSVTETRYGWIRTIGALDYAGGTVVHITSGFSALVASILVGPRKVCDKATKKKKYTHVPYVLLGGALLWFGWFGFNSGSALAATDIATMAFANTQIATAMSMSVWILLDMIFKDKATGEGAMCGAVVGLVAITPCAGFIHLQSSLAIGFLSCLAVYGSVVVKSKYFPRYFPQVDDSLDAFTCHGIGAIVGALLLGFFASKSVNPAGNDGVFFGNPILLAYQLLAVVVTIVWSVIVTALILYPLQKTIGITADDHVIRVGFDSAYHGKKGDIDGRSPSNAPKVDLPALHKENSKENSKDGNAKRRTTSNAV
jgi:Amt family ammonium transporter